MAPENTQGWRRRKLWSFPFLRTMVAGLSIGPQSYGLPCANFAAPLAIRLFRFFKPCPMLASVSIIDFAPAHQSAFRALNHAWITRYFALEAPDHQVLDDP